MDEIRHCYVCNKSESTSIKPSCFFYSKTWDQYCCNTHMDDGTPLCFGCARFKPSHLEYYSLGRDRDICADCLPFSIMDKKKQCEPLVANVLNFFKDCNLKNEMDRVSVLLVDELGDEDIEALFDFEKDNFMEVVHCLQDGNNIRTVKSLKIVDAESDGSALILFGMTRSEMGVGLVECMLGGWLENNGLADIIGPLDYERLCILAGCEWLKSSSSMDPSYTPEQAQYYKRLMNCTLVLIEQYATLWSDGFGKFKPFIDTYGLKNLVTYLTCHRQLPPSLQEIPFSATYKRNKESEDSDIDSPPNATFMRNKESEDSDIASPPNATFMGNKEIEDSDINSVWNQPRPLGCSFRRGFALKL